MTGAERAAHLLAFYLREAWEKAGLRWNEDNDTECQIIIDAIIRAAQPKGGQS